ncbi:MAG: chain length determinant protein EpsF, partial [Methylibium sp.]|nr:chain length determinant protein EpsF [Methylibium sp.]
LDVVRSERVALRALRSPGLKLTESLELRAQWQAATEGQGDFEAWLAALIQKKLDILPSRESNVITLAYSSPDPQFSAAVANAFMQAYIDTTLDLKVEPAKQYNSFFDDRAKQTRDALEQAQAKLSAYQQAKGIVATDERLDVENARLSELTTQMVVLQGAAAESRGRQDEANGNNDRMQEVLANPVVGALTADLSRQQARLNELNERLGDNHPQVVELRANIEELRKRVQAQTSRVAGSLNANNNVNQVRLAQLNAEIQQQRSKLLQLKGQRDEAAVLLRDVENAQRSYDAVLTRVNQTSMESQNTQTNVSVLKQATPPAFPSSPRPLLNVAVALVMGSLLGIGLMLARELLDRRMRTVDDVVSGLRQPLLVVLPRASRQNARGGSNLRLAKARVVRGLAGPARS